MTNPMMNSQPNYSGVTIQISNPAVYAGSAGNGANCEREYTACPINSINQNAPAQPQLNAMTNPMDQNRISTNTNPYAQLDPAYNALPAPQAQTPAYPPQYYLNNYNYSNNGTANGALPTNVANDIPYTADVAEAQNPNETELTETIKNTKTYEAETEEPQDFTKSQAVIDDLNARALAMEEEKKNSKQKRVVALTDEYIKSLENYLNNPNDEIRLMASKEILTRLDEDKERYDDAALNALLNKMLQDPSKLIRVAALSAFASQLASGNDYTVELLRNIQQNPSADKEDIVQAADILLKMSYKTEIKHVPYPAVKEKPAMERTKEEKTVVKNEGQN